MFFIEIKYSTIKILELIDFQNNKIKILEYFWKLHFELINKN